MNKSRKFRLHFNRVNMQRGKSTVWTIHLSDRCIPAENVHVQVPITTVFRPSGPQPRAWFVGVGCVSRVAPNEYVIHG